MTDMEIDAAGVQFIAAHEGFSEVKYEDVAGIDSIGYGHRIIPQDAATYGPLETVTTELALQILHNDVAHAVSCVNECIEVDLNQDQFNACVSLCYNIGGRAFQDSTLVKMLNNGQFSDAADQFLRWDKSGGVEVEGLLNRRQDEKALFLS